MPKSEDAKCITYHFPCAFVHDVLLHIDVAYSLLCLWLMMSITVLCDYYHAWSHTLHRPVQ